MKQVASRVLLAGADGEPSAAYRFTSHVRSLIEQRNYHVIALDRHPRGNQKGRVRGITAVVLFWIRERGIRLVPGHAGKKPF